MNNKRLGSAFERELCQELKEKGWWVHFLSPGLAGTQPFDIIAVKKGIAIAIDAKTSVTHRFSIGRLEDNQIMAFEKWLQCGNSMPYVAVKYQENIIWLTYFELKKEKIIDLRTHEKKGIIHENDD